MQRGGVSYDTSPRCFTLCCLHPCLSHTLLSTSQISTALPRSQKAPVSSGAGYGPERPLRGMVSRGAVSFCNDFIWHSTSGGQCEIIIINYNCGSSSPNSPIFLRKFQCPIPQFIGKRTTATAFNNFSALYLLTALSLLNSCRYAAPQVLFQADTQCSIRHTARQYPQNIPLSH